MKRFYGEDLFLTTNTARKLYAAVRNLPIIDYHCHLDPAKIKEDAGFSGIGELWLSGDHYKWRAMRSCGVGVSYSEAMPGDIICYSGHVAIYMGGGAIVHASTASVENTIRKPSS